MLVFYNEGVMTGDGSEGNAKLRQAVPQSPRWSQQSPRSPMSPSRQERPNLRVLCRFRYPLLHGRAGAAPGVPSAAFDATACDAAFSSPPQWAAAVGAQAMAVGLG